jgi:hypothetical protein
MPVVATSIITTAVVPMAVVTTAVVPMAVVPTAVIPMAVIPMAVVPTAVVTRAVVTAAVIASISAVPIGITIVSGPGARSKYHRRTVEDGRRRIDNRRTGIHGARHANADAYRHTTRLREAGQPRA